MPAVHIVVVLFMKIFTKRQQIKKLSYRFKAGKR